MNQLFFVHRIRFNADERHVAGYGADQKKLGIGVGASPGRPTHTRYPLVLSVDETLRLCKNFMISSIVNVNFSQVNLNG